jgi:MFS family permease
VSGVAPAQRPGSALLALVACQIGLHACTQGARLAAPLQALQQGRGALTVGVLLALLALLAIPAGRLADRFGYHLPVRVAASLSLAGAVIAACSASTAALCTSAALCGAGSGFGMIAVQRTAGRLARDGTERMRIFSWVALAPAVANLLGPLLAGMLIDGFGFRAAFAGLALLPAATLLWSQAVPRELPPAPVAAARRPPAWDLLREPAFRRLLAVNWMVSTSWDVFGFALPIVGQQRGLSASAIGGVLAAYAVASMAVRLLIPVVAHRLSRRRTMAAALLVTALVFGVFPMLQASWAMLAAAAVLGLALGAIQPAILASVHDVAPAGRQGEALALRSMSVHLSMATMPLVFGAAGAAIGATALFWLMSVTLCAGGCRAWSPRRA